jgi:hypothetical protein
MRSFGDIGDGAHTLVADARWRRIGYAVLLAVLALLCFFPRPEVGRAKVVPQEPTSAMSLSGGAGRLQDLSAIFGGGRRAIDLYLTIGKSEDVRKQVIRDLKLIGSSPRYATLNDALIRLERKVDIQSLPGGVIEIEVTTSDAAESLSLTKGYAAALAQRFKVLNNQQLSTKNRLVTTRFADSANRLGQAEAALDAFRRNNRLSAAPQAELGAALTVRTGLEAQLQAKLVELDTLRGFLGPENPRMLSVQSEVGELRSRLAQSAAPTGDSAAPNSGTLTRLSNEYANVYRDYLFAQSVYQIYMRISEEVAVEELSGQTSATVQVIEQPHLDVQRHYNVWAVSLLAMVLLAVFFTEIYAPGTGIDLWRRREIPAT